MRVTYPQYLLSKVGLDNKQRIFEEPELNCLGRYFNSEKEWDS